MRGNEYRFKKNSSSFYLGNTVVITRPGPKTPRLSRSKLKGFLGPRSSFAAEVTFSSFSDDQAILELETCSGMTCSLRFSSYGC